MRICVLPRFGSTVIVVATLVALTGAARCDAGDPHVPDEVLRRYERSIVWGLRRAPEIDVARVIELRDASRLILVDVRTAEERAVSGIAGAITPDDLDGELEQRPQATVVVYCTIGARSAAVTRDLRARDIAAYNLVGGVLAWAHARQPFEHNGEATTAVHVYSRSWDLLPDGYEAIW